MIQAFIRAGLLACIVPGCTLIDQRTFNPNAGVAPVIPPAPAVMAAPAPSGPPPLLTIRSTEPAGDAVQQAVAAARQRKPDVVFDVIAIVPAPDQADAASAEAGRVARVIAAQGVAPSRVRLLARDEPGLPTREVRVYVR